MSLSVDIHHQLGDFDLNVAFTAPPGVTVLFGRSGSGKTSVINAVAGLFTPKQGHISVGARPVFDAASGLNLPPHKRRFGYVFQDARLFPHMSVARNLTYGQGFAPKGTAFPNKDRVVDMLGIGALLSRRPAALSGGERQRVAIGRALLSGPDMILADEPLAALDAERKAEILPYFERLRDELEIPMLYVSHSAAEVARLATTIVALEQGHVLRAGPAADIMSDPAITPLGAQEAGAVIEAVITIHHADGLTEVQAGGWPLLLPRVAGNPGQMIRIHVAAQDVMLARNRPEGISALNILPATIGDIRIGDGPGALVQLEAGSVRLLSRITQRSLRTLSLNPGDRVFAVLKAVSVARKAPR